MMALMGSLEQQEHQEREALLVLGDQLDHQDLWEKLVKLELEANLVLMGHQVQRDILETVSD